jgi:hypothetical protein
VPAHVKIIRDFRKPGNDVKFGSAWPETGVEELENPQPIGI